MENYETLPTDYSAYESLGPVFAVFAGAWFLFTFLIMVVMAVAMWKIYRKAGKPGWAALIPVYNMYILLSIVGRPGWWLLLFFIPMVNMVVSLLLAIDMARSFKRSDAFGILGLWLFSLVGYLYLGFGESKYIGPSAKSA